MTTCNSGGAHHWGTPTVIEETRTHVRIRWVCVKCGSAMEEVEPVQRLEET